MTTQEQELAIADFFEAICPPQSVRPAMRKKFLRLKMTPDQIRENKDYLLQCARDAAPEK